jgi:hypothetical protein
VSEEDPRSPEEERDDEESSPDVPEVIIPEPGDDDLVDIEFAIGDIDPILAVRLEGPGISVSDVQVDLAGGFLSLLDKLIRGMSARLAGLSIPKRGRIPTPAGMLPIRLGKVVFGHSVILFFTIPEGEEEETLFASDVSPYSVRAVEMLTELLRLEADETLVEGVHRLGDRVGNEYVELVSVLAERDLRSDWKVQERPTVRVPPERAAAARAQLRSETQTVVGELEMTGELFRADSRRNSFRLDTEEGESISGTYPQALEETVRSAWAKTVTVTLRRTEYRWPYSDEPHEVIYELVDVLTILD